MKTLIQNIEAWAAERNLLAYENAENQHLKYLEEVGETARAILKKDTNGIIDGFGDIAVTIIVLAKQLGCNLKINFEPDNLQLNKSFFWFMIGIEDCDVDYASLDYLNDVSMYYGYSLEECLTAAWNEIKNRTGKTVDGVFIKN